MVIIENSVADEQKLAALMSSSGRISYSSSNFLRFWRQGFIEDHKLMESKDRLQGKLRSFSREMARILEENKESFTAATLELLNKKGFLYEEDLFKSVFRRADMNEMENAFAVHKFLFESTDNWIKDGQWSLSLDSDSADFSNNSDTKSVCDDSINTGPVGAGSVPYVRSGPYVMRPKWQRELLEESRKLLRNEKEVERFKSKVQEILKNKKPNPSISEELFMKCLKVFTDEFYVNVQNYLTPNPIKEIVNIAFMGVAIVDSQSQAKELYEKLCGNRFDYFEASKPLLNSFVSSNIAGSYKNLVIKEQSEPSSSLDTCDFENLAVYLIDPEGTVEVDDGISVEAGSNLNEAILHVHVADPSDLVTGELEREAQRRVGSLYLPEIKVPMLPESINLQSTLKGDHRIINTLTFSCKIDLETGELKDQKIRKGIIRNLKHMTYDEAEIVKGSNRDLDLLKKISKSHLQYRESRGHVDFSFPRGLAQLDRENKRVLVKIDGLVEMKKIVAEAMIIAGRIAGENLRDRGIAAPFRAHASGAVTDNNPKTLLEKYEMLKQMPAASVSITPRPHVSMGLDAYVKVTSPLRRFLDLITHKIIKGRDLYDREWFANNLSSVRRQEIYNKKFSFGVNRFWIERFIWQEEQKNGAAFKESLWTLTPLERIKEGLWTVHVEEVASNFIVQMKNGTRMELGESVKGRITSRSHESILKFELI